MSSKISLSNIKKSEIDRIVKDAEERIKDMGEGTMSYNANGDAMVGFRSIKWLEEDIFTHDIWQNKESVLDVGCGNGRVNFLYGKYFDKIVCIDPYVNIQDYCKKRVEKFKVRFEDFEYPDKFDIISFIFTFYLFTKKHKEIIEKCIKHLNENGAIVIIDGAEWSKKSKKDRAFDLNKICNELNLEKEIIIEFNKNHKKFEYIFAILKRK